MEIDKQLYKSSVLNKSIKLFLTIFMLTGTIISGVMMVFYHSITKNELDISKEKELFFVGLQYQSIQDSLSAIVGDILFLSQQNELKEYFSTGNEDLLDDIGKEYSYISKHKKIYDQIRLLDSEGMETIRVNFNEGVPGMVPLNELQSKKNRYYFEDCFKLDKEDIFISPFDLNIEQDNIEQPFKPMIRLGTPIFDSFGEKRGVVLVNYFGRKLLDKIRELEPVSEGETMLLNAEGYWLLHPQPEREWGFMFNDPQRTLAVVDPVAWKQINGQDRGQIETHAGVYTFKTVFPAKTQGNRSITWSVEDLGIIAPGVDHGAYHWHLISFLSADKITSIANSYLVKFFTIGAGLFFLIAIGSWMIAFAVTKRKLYQGQLQIMALFDPLTKLPNRILFFDRLKMAAEHSRRYNSQFGLLYIDLDGFKNVNDSFGHDVGDELLRAVASLLIKACRKSDTVARMGGDEFAIIYDEFVSLSAIEDFSARLIDTLKPPVELDKGIVTIGASIGIARFPVDSDNLEELISLADKAMYVSKNRGKNNYTFATISHIDEI